MVTAPRVACPRPMSQAPQATTATTGLSRTAVTAPIIQIRSHMVYRSTDHTWVRRWSNTLARSLPRPRASTVTACSAVSATVASTTAHRAPSVR